MYRIGDQVMIMDADRIDDIAARSGEILAVIDLWVDGTPILRDKNGMRLELYQHEVQFIQKVEVHVYVDEADLKANYFKTTAFKIAGEKYSYVGSANVDGQDIHRYHCRRKNHSYMIILINGQVTEIKNFVSTSSYVLKGVK